jgi:hypothetical protein
VPTAFTFHLSPFTSSLISLPVSRFTWGKNNHLTSVKMKLCGPVDVKSSILTTTLRALLLLALTLHQFPFELTVNLCVHGWTSYYVPARRNILQRRRIKHDNESRLKLQNLKMVRNIDLPEAVIFYGTKTLVPSYVTNESDDEAIQRFRNAEFDDDTSVMQARSGLSRFLQECHDIETAVIVLLDGDDDENHGIEQQHAKRTNNYVLDAILPDKISRLCHVFTQTVTPPDPTDVLAILNLIYIQPRPYGGGGSTIGYRRAPDPERLIEPKHCVMFTTTLHQTRVARALGMRVISMNMDDHLADAVLMEIDDDDSDNNVSINLSVDDIATPGSYWLNPPHPRDDNVNQVLDPYDCMKKTTSMDQVYIRNANNYDENVETEESDEYLQAILSDIAPLKGSE